MNNQTLTIIRGLPGSGKSTLAFHLRQSMQMQGVKVSHYEADMFFLNAAGEYLYDASMIKDAHIWCKGCVFEDLGEGWSVIVSNTFTEWWEMQPYVAKANSMGIDVQIIECKGKFENTHNVPKDVIKRMKERWENVELGEH